MGGYGSGRTPTVRAEDFCEEWPQICIRDLNAQARENGRGVGFLLWQWCDKNKAIGLPDVAYTQCHYGGRRAWFLCPECKARRGVLYLQQDKDGRKTLCCRECLGLVYEIRNLDRGDRRLRECTRLRARLFHKQPLIALFRQVVELQAGGCLAPLPPRPKGLHQATYARLKKQHDAAQEEVYNLKIKPLLARANCLIEEHQRTYPALLEQMEAYHAPAKVK